MGIAGAGLSYKCFKGEEIREVTEGLAELRITVFKDFPYLYDGDLSYEKQYLEIYSSCPRSFLFAVFDEGKMVGATTCIPLIDETPDVKEPFIERKMNLEEIFYFGERILLKQYRGLGLGNRFFEEREKYAFSYDEIRKVCFCAVKRPVDHILKPKEYMPLDEFWKKRGFIKVENMVSYFDWKDIGETTSTAKPMEYWFKNR